MIFSFSVRVMK